MKVIPEIYGLVLAGGKSTRMGTDKRQLDYHGKAQQDYAFELLASVCEKVFVSLRGHQVVNLREEQFILDKNVADGPLDGILSAHLTHPEVAWLVLACDTPLVDTSTLETLIAGRDATKMATAMATRKTNLPEPLIAIWEPKGLKSVQAYLETWENSGPRKFLMNYPVKKVYPSSDVELTNVNQPEEFEHIQHLLKTQSA